MFSKTLVSSIVASFKGEAQAIAKARIEQDKQFNKALDAVTLACDKPKAEFLKGNSVKNPARAEVKALFDNLVEQGFISKASGAQYQSCFWIAFETGVPFSRDLANKKSDAKTKKDATPKAGPVISTTRESLDKTLSKALGQARALGLTEFAAEMLDLCIESLDDFKETVLDK
jgi:phage antirepressor YoqD-like protein